jgi:hypothetical protein
MLAVLQGSEPDKAKKVVDFLLAKSVSPAESDHIKGYLDFVLLMHEMTLTCDCIQAGISTIGYAIKISLLYLNISSKSCQET